MNKISFITNIPLPPLTISRPQPNLKMAQKEFALVEIPGGPDQESDLTKLYSELALEISSLPTNLKAEKVLDFFRRNVNRPINIKVLSEYVGLTTGPLYKQFREIRDLAKLQSLVPAAAAQGIASSSFHHAANPSSVLRHARQSTQHHQLAIDGPLRVSGGAPWITTSLTCQFPHSCPTLGASTSYAGIVAEPAAATALSRTGAQVPSPPPTPFCRRQLLCPASVC